MKCVSTSFKAAKNGFLPLGFEVAFCKNYGNCFCPKKGERWKLLTLSTCLCAIVFRGILFLWRFHCLWKMETEDFILCRLSFFLFAAAGHFLRYNVYVLCASCVRLQKMMVPYHLGSQSSFGKNCGKWFSTIVAHLPLTWLRDCSAWIANIKSLSTLRKKKSMKRHFEISSLMAKI